MAERWKGGVQEIPSLRRRAGGCRGMQWRQAPIGCIQCGSGEGDREGVGGGIFVGENNGVEARGERSREVRGQPARKIEAGRNRPGRRQAADGQWTR